MTVFMNIFLFVSLLFHLGKVDTRKDETTFHLPKFVAEKLQQIQQSDARIRGKKIACFIDFSQPSFEKRLYVVDLQKQVCLMNTWVAHGKGSGRNAMAEYFSNDSGSLCSSLGVFEPIGQFYGKHGLSIRLKGLDKGVNDNAVDRGIIVHAADYISEKNASFTNVKEIRSVVLPSCQR
jgi:hypothetical protein